MILKFKSYLYFYFLILTGSLNLYRSLKTNQIISLKSNVPTRLIFTHTLNLGESQWNCLCLFGFREETRASGVNPSTHVKNIKIPCRQCPSKEFNPRPSCEGQFYLVIPHNTEMWSPQQGVFVCTCLQAPVVGDVIGVWHTIPLLTQVSDITVTAWCMLYGNWTPEMKFKDGFWLNGLQTRHPLGLNQD